MKGKGKGIGDSKDCPLQFPDLKPVDHTKSCPLYSSVLSRTQEEGIGGDEIDRLQTELETLLASAGKRLQLLQKEIQTLNNWQDKKEKKPAPGKVENSVVKNKNETLKNFPASDVPVVKRGKGGSGAEDKPNKKFKDSNGKATHCSGPGRPKNKNSQVKMPDYDISESSDIARSQKNDIVNRFWASVDPYCAEISTEDMKVLEEVLVTIKDDSEFFKIPPLGKHYSERWAQEDIMDEQKEGAKISDKRRNNNNSTATNSNESTNLLKKSESWKGSNDDSPFGPLTQRLVTALIEEHVMAPVDDTTADISTKDLEDPPSISPKMLAKQLNISNAVQLEKRIKKELEEQGILDFDEKVEDNPDDEILSELRRKQEELKAINHQNTIMTKRLMKLAREEIESQKLRKKLVALDAELLEAYRKVQSARQKKRQPTKREKDAVWKILHDREDILKQLDG